MSFKTHKLLDGVTSTGAGTAINLIGTAYKSGRAFPVIVRGITTATVVLQGSIDGTNYVTIAGSSFTADTATSLTCPFPYIRANCTAYAAGTITVEIAD